MGAKKIPSTKEMQKKKIVFEKVILFDNILQIFEHLF